MANLMPLGYRALGIRVNAESIAGGFASLPHSRVDIVNTVRRSDEKTSYAQLLLEDVLVLAADAQISRNENSPAMLANVVTVALKPEDAMKVALAREIGTLSLVLRRFNDKGRSEETKITVEGLITKTAGSGNAEIASDNPAAPSAAKVPNVPAIPKVQAKPAVEATQVAKNEPKGKIFRMRILEGNKERFVGFPQDENGNFVQPEVNRTDLTPARPEAKKNDIN